jgi:glycosyltransferase involved in cell wall biosynthesis
MRFHCLGVPHTISSPDYVSCAYTQKVVKFCKMMRDRGHIIFHYGHEDSIVECHEHITVVTREQFNKIYGKHDHTTKFFKYDTSDDVYTTFSSNAIVAINERKEINDFILPFWGYAAKNICDAHPDLICVEPGIGYGGGHWAKWKIFESYAIYHAYCGLSSVSRCQQSWYDVVIPNYFNTNDFEYCDEKEDYFLFVGRIYEGKGIHIAIQVTEKIGAKLLVCGQGSLEDCGYKTIPEHVTYIGSIDKTNRKMLMSKAKGAFVASQYVEPFGGVQIEMLMSGTPTITTDWGAFTENNIHGVTGYRCRTFDHFCWAAKNIDKIKPSDCRKWALNFTLENISKMYEEYFQMVLDVYNSKGWYQISENRNDLNWLNKNLSKKIKWYTFFTKDYTIWYEHLKCKLKDKFEVNGILLNELNIHNQHCQHHFTGCSDRIKLIIAAIYENLGETIVFSDCTLYFKDVDKLHEIISNSSETTYAKNSVANDINIGLIVLKCTQDELNFWHNVLEKMGPEVHEQTLVDNLATSTPNYNYSLFNRNDVFCGFVINENKHIVPETFCALKLFVTATSDKYTRFIDRLNTLTMLKLKL